MCSERQLTDSLLMIRPVRFFSNSETAGSNAFQMPNAPFHEEEAQKHALEEFENLVKLLISCNLKIYVFEDTVHPNTPDSIFPNNWISTHANGTISLFPMESPNRRLERRIDIVCNLSAAFRFTNVHDMTHYEAEKRYLEGTGSMVLDRPARILYSALSSRAHPALIDEFAKQLGYKAVIFRAYAQHNGTDHPIYHTNVVMSVGESVSVVCLESISSIEERQVLLLTLQRSGKEVIEISSDQLHQFAGNILQVISSKGTKHWIMSTRAFEALDELQKRMLRRDGSQIVHSPLSTIELLGGGSARCMIAEIHPPRN